LDAVLAPVPLQLVIQLRSSSSSSRCTQRDFCMYTAQFKCVHLSNTYTYTLSPLFVDGVVYKPGKSVPPGPEARGGYW